MKPVVIGAVTGVALAILALVIGAIYLLSSLLSEQFPRIGGTMPTPSASPSPGLPSPGMPSPTPQPSPTSTSTVPAANVNFQVLVTGVTGTGLSRTVSAQITNTGTADAHNVWLKLEVFSQGVRITVNGQDYVRVDIGTLKTTATIAEQVTISVGVLDALKIATGGATIVLTIYSDERTQTLSYDYRS